MMLTSALPNRFVVATVVFAVVSSIGAAAGCSSDSGSEPLSEREQFSADLVDTSDCIELETMASAQVDVITATDDQAVIDDATNKFNEIVNRIETIC